MSHSHRYAALFSLTQLTNKNAYYYYANNLTASHLACVHVCVLHCGRVFYGFLWVCLLQQFISIFKCYIVVTSSPQNAFVQLSLAYRNDNYTLEMRLKQAERERNLTEEDTEKELEEFKGALKVSPGIQPLMIDWIEKKNSLWLFSARSSL